MSALTFAVMAARDAYRDRGEAAVAVVDAYRPDAALHDAALVREWARAIVGEAYGLTRPAGLARLAVSAARECREGVHDPEGAVGRVAYRTGTSLSFRESWCMRLAVVLALEVLARA